MAKSPKDDIKYLEAKLKRNPNSILFARLADAYASIDRIDDAIHICEDGLRKHPYYVTGHYMISKCYLKKKQYDHAEKELKRVLLFDPEYIAAHRDYGDLMAQIGWHSSCERSYEKIQFIDPFNKQAKEKIKQIKENLKLDENVANETDVNLDEFEEEAMVADEHNYNEEPEEHETLSKGGSQKIEDYDDFDELFSEEAEGSNEEFPSELEDDLDKTDEFAEEPVPEDTFPPVVDQNIDEEDEEELSEEEENEKFNYILDDIFREDNIKSESAEDIDSNTHESPEDREKLDEHDEGDISQLTLDQIDQLTADEIGDQERYDVEEGEVQEMFNLDNEEPTQQADEDIDESTVENLDKWLESFKGAVPDSGPDLSQYNEHTQPDQASDDRFGTKKKEKIVTPTLGEIYAAQHQYAKAIGVYEILKKNNPDNPMYEQKIENLKRKLEDSQDD